MDTHEGGGWRGRLRTLMQDRGTNAKQLARDIEAGPSFVYDLFKGAVPNIESFARMAGVLRVSLDDLYRGEGTARPGISGRRPLPLFEVPYEDIVCRIVCDGNIWRYLAPSDEFSVMLPGWPRGIAVIMDQPGGRTAKGDVLFCAIATEPEWMSFDAMEALVETTGGYRLLRRVIYRADRKADLYSNRDEPPMRDVVLTWSAPVVAILKEPIVSAIRMKNQTDS